MRVPKRLTIAVALSLACGLTASAHADDDARQPSAKHVLLVSVDGLHQADLDWFVNANPNSTLALLVRHGVAYTNAQTPFPSDSFPGMVGQVTGGNPKTTGIYYDDAYSRSLLPKGTTAANCHSTKPGAEVFYAEVIAKDLNRLDSGQNIPGLYADFSRISQLTGHPQDLIDPAFLPVSPVTCQPVYPHQYLKVNTIFEVAKKHGLHTAWSDKHVAYEILNGPSGQSIDDLFAPEINSSVTDPSLPAGPGDDWTKDNTNTQRYDSFKVKAVLNWIKGLDHAGNGMGSDATGTAVTKAFSQAGARKIYAGEEAADLFGVGSNDDRVPDLVGIAQQGTVYAGGKLSKIAEHGGGAKQDRHVPIVVWGAGIGQNIVDDPVQTNQIAPTILALLGLKPHELQAVQAEHTKVLPHLR